MAPCLESLASLPEESRSVVRFVVTRMECHLTKSQFVWSRLHVGGDVRRRTSDDQHRSSQFARAPLTSSYHSVWVQRESFSDKPCQSVDHYIGPQLASYLFSPTMDEHYGKRESSPAGVYLLAIDLTSPLLVPPHRRHHSRHRCHGMCAVRAALGRGQEGVAH